MIASDKLSTLSTAALEFARPDGPERARWGALILMVSLSIMSMIDRFILALLVQPLRAELGVTDVQLGLLFGTTFAVFYAIIGIPIARAADRAHRVRLISAAVILWSVCTILSGFASSFAELLVLRAGLAIGEAALFPAVHSLLPDMFDCRRRLLATTIYTASPPAGATLAFMAGGPLISLIETAVSGGLGWGLSSWRLTFHVVGALSLAIGLLFAATVREPERTVGNAVRGSSAGMASLEGRRLLFAALFLAAGSCQFLPYAYQAWAPTLLIEQYNMTMAQAGLGFGIASAVGSIGGSLIFPLLTLRGRDGGLSRRIASVLLVAVMLGSTVYVLTPLQGSAAHVLAGIAAGNFMLVGCVATLQVLIPLLAPGELRATLTAGALFAMTLIGLGTGPLTAAALAGIIGLKISLSALAVVSGLVALGSFSTVFLLMPATSGTPDSDLH